MPRATYLTLRGSTFYARIPLSIADQEIFRRKEVWRSLKCRSYKEAIERLSYVMYQFVQDKEGFMTLEHENLNPANLAWLVDQYGKRVFNHHAAQCDNEIQVTRADRYEFENFLDDVLEDGEIVVTELHPKKDPSFSVGAVHLAYAKELEEKVQKLSMDLVNERYEDAIKRLHWRLEDLAVPIEAMLKKRPRLINELFAEEIRAIEEFIDIAKRGGSAPIRKKLTQQALSPEKKAKTLDTVSDNEITFSQLIEIYNAAPENKKTTGRAKKTNEYQKFLLSILGENIKLGKIDSNQVRRLSEVLNIYPANASKFYPNKTPDEIHTLLQAGPIEKRLLSETTKKNYIRELRALLTWAHTEGIIDRIPIPKGLGQGKASDKNKRESYTNEELSHILSDSELIAYRNSRESHKYWVPIVALFTGMRLAEILLITLEEIRTDEGTGILYFGIKKTSHRSLKTSQSARRIPIPDILISLGFNKLLEAARSNKNGLLFNKVAGSKSPPDTFSKWWGRQLKRLDIKHQGLTFHSFRHTYRDAIRHIEPNSYDAKIANLLGGWESRDIGENYGTGDTLENLKKVQDRITNEGLKQACELALRGAK